MNELLHVSGGVIALWLEAKLPALGSNWWVDNVLNRLTFQQQRLVKEKRTQSLSGLDLAAVLRVLDQNWSELAGVEPLPREARNWIKELQNVRNRWAHAPAGGLSVSDSYRDADTLERFLYVINAGDALLSRVEEFKQTTLSRMAPPSQASAVATISGPAQAAPPAESAAPTSVLTHIFSVGQLLCLRSNPGAVFPVLEVLPSVGAETRYRVFESGARQIYYESQLQALDEPADSHKVLTAIEFSAMLTAVQLSSPSASTLYSLNSGRVRFVPYQYRPIFKLIRADQPRLLVADEVGVGKTIEAGLILKELCSGQLIPDTTLSFFSA